MHNVLDGEMFQLVIVVLRDRNLGVCDICPICRSQYSLKNNQHNNLCFNSEMGAIFLRVITFCLKRAGKAFYLVFFFMEFRANNNTSV